MKRVLIIEGTFRYNLGNLFLHDLGEALERLGKKVEWFRLDSGENSSRDFCNLMLEEENEFVLSINGIRPSLNNSDGKHIFDDLKIPFVTYLIDNPIHHASNLSLESIFVLCYASEHLSFIQTYFEGRKASSWLPHGACRSDLCFADIERDIDILFAGTYPDPSDSFRDISLLQDEYREIVDKTVDLVLSKDCIAVDVAVISILKDRGIDISKDLDLYKKYIGCAYYAESVTRSIKRIEILKEIDRAGIAVDIYGEGWPQGLFKNHRLNGQVELAEILKLMSRSRIVLNSIMIPGSHERVVSAMINGAMCLSDYNNYFASEFTDHKNIVFYKWTEKHKLPLIINNLLKQPELILQIARKGTDCAQKFHSWDVRAKKLLEIVSKWKKLS